MGKMIPRNDKGRVIGEQHHRARLTDDEVDLILYLRSQGLTHREIADKFDDGGFKPSRETVRDICLGHRRSQIATTYTPSAKRYKP